MSYKFPYFEGRPHVPVALEYQGSKARFLPLLDTGADFSIFYKSDAVRIGLDWDKGKEVTLLNADGSEFNAKEFSLEVMFSKNLRLQSMKDLKS